MKNRFNLKRFGKEICCIERSLLIIFKHPCGIFYCFKSLVAAMAPAWHFQAPRCSFAKNTCTCLGLVVSVSGFRFPGSGTRLPGSRFRDQVSRFRVLGSGFRFSVSGFRFRDHGSGFQFPVSGFWFLVSGFRFPVSGFRVPGKEDVHPPGIQSLSSCTDPSGFQRGLAFKAHRLVYHSTLGLRVIKKKRRPVRGNPPFHRARALTFFPQKQLSRFCQTIAH